MMEACHLRLVQYVVGWSDRSSRLSGRRVREQVPLDVMSMMYRCVRTQKMQQGNKRYKLCGKKPTSPQWQLSQKSSRKTDV